MVDGNVATRKLGALLAADRGHLERLNREPFVARLVVEWEDAPGALETLYVTRASAAAVGCTAPAGKLVTYTAPLGRLAEFPSGEMTTVRVEGRGREARIHERLRLRPDQRDGEWDGLEDRFEFEGWQVSLDSLRALLAQLVPGLEELDLVSALRKRAIEEQLLRTEQRRRVIERISLRDQPILDRYQGEVFRMPLDRKLLLVGPPGTGKTTTLIRRLAQKRTPEALTEDEERAIADSGLGTAFGAAETWAMFSPTELLSLYLRDAFNREGVAATDRNLRTWDKERLELARNVLGILRSADAGVFQLDESMNALLDGSSAGLRQIFDAVSAYVETNVLDHTTAALRSLEEAADNSIKAAVAQLRRALGAPDRLALRHVGRLVDAAPEVLQAEIRRLDDAIRSQGDRVANRLLSVHGSLLEELSNALPRLTTDGARAPEEDEEEEADEGDEALSPSRDATIRAFGVLLSTIRTAARAAALGRPRVGGRAARVLELLGERQPSQSEMSSLGVLLVTRGQLRALRQAPWRFVMGVPRLYAAFRREAVKDGRLFKATATDAIRQGRISAGETDVVILAMLRNARLLAGEPHVARLEWLDAIHARRLAQVFVDEATDFSAVQLACTLELTHPRLRSWFACGDLLQRVTPYGLRDFSELKWITGGESPVEVREVRIGYRQARRLRELGATLARGQGQPVEAPAGEEDADVWPLLAEHNTGAQLGAWLADRIFEVERAIGLLPSIAVFVDGEDRVDELVGLVQSHLQMRNVPIVGCKGGRVVGDAREVRVFDVRHIKGLEFEAVFFVGIDRLAQRLPDLFDRYLYVGITRAATYLGVTCEQSLPASLEFARPNFGDASDHPW
jgi:DNA polymerase III delta prime subunit